MQVPSIERPSLEGLRQMPVSDLIEMPAEHLALLQVDVADAVDAALRMQDCIAAAIALRYEQRAVSARAAAGKNVGTVRLRDDTVEVVVELPRRVEWDPVQLAAIVERLHAGGEDPGQFLEVSLTISEAAYIAWPERVRAAFEPARTVRTDRATYRLEITTATEDVVSRVAARRISGVAR